MESKPHSEPVVLASRWQEAQERIRELEEQLEATRFDLHVALDQKLVTEVAFHELKEQLEAAERKIVDYDRILQLREEVELRDGPINLTPVEGERFLAAMRKAKQSLGAAGAATPLDTPDEAQALQSRVSAPIPCLRCSGTGVEPNPIPDAGIEFLDDESNPAKKPEMADE